MIATQDMARSVKPRAAEYFRRYGEVLGVGVVRCGDGYGVKVNLRTPPSAGTSVPDEIDGVPIRVAIVGEVRQGVHAY